MITEAQLKACKAYMRVDGDFEDALISALYSAATEYLTGAGIARTTENANMYDLAAQALALHYYDHRDAVGTEAVMPQGIRPIITQLKIAAQAQRAAEAEDGGAEY